LGISKRWGHSHPDSRDWPTYNEPFGVRGEFLLDLTLFETRDEERLNRGKLGAFPAPLKVTTIMRGWRVRPLDRAVVGSGEESLRDFPDHVRVGPGVPSDRSRVWGQRPASRTEERAATPR